MKEIQLSAMKTVQLSGITNMDIMLSFLNGTNAHFVVYYLTRRMSPRVFLNPGETLYFLYK